MTDLIKDMGRVLEAVEQNYKTQESLWNNLNQTKREVSSITTELKLLAKSIDHLNKSLTKLNKESSGTNKLLTEVDLEFKSNRKWIHRILGILATLIPLVWAQVLSKSDTINELETKVVQLEWIISRDNSNVKFPRIFESSD